MGQPSQPGRRAFIGACSGAALACSPLAAIAATAEHRAFDAATLTNTQGEPLRCADLAPNTEYVFAYPFKSTPCFLINLPNSAVTPSNLSTLDGRAYRWPGGIGAERRVVAYSAICAHKLSHPTSSVSFIGYREYPVGFLNRDTGQVEQRSGVIQCCSEHSLYDPAQGATVLSGPAPQPLAAIDLVEQDGVLVARGVYGGLLFEPYFERFGERLMLEYKGDDFAAPVGPSSTVFTGAEYSRHRIRCT